MPSRILFALRRLGLDASRWLGSWRLSIVLMVAAALYHGFLAIWSASSPPHVVANIASLLPFWLVYGLLLLNTGVCFWRRLPALRRQLPHGFAPLGSYLFHGAFFLLAAGFLLTLALRQEAKLWAAVGETFEGRPDQFLSRTPPRILTGPLPEIRFTVWRVEPEFWRDRLLFTRLSAELELDGERVTTRINRPLWLGWGTFLRLSGFGYAPRYELADRHGVVIDSAFVKLDVFPPGQRDFFQLPDYPHRFYLQVLPDFALEGGEALTRSLNLVAPAVDLHAFRGRLDLGRAHLRPEEAFDFEGLALGFPEIRYWGELSLVIDPGAPVIFAGFLLALAGLALKLLARPAEARPAGAEEPA